MIVSCMEYISDRGRYTIWNQPEAEVRSRINDCIALRDHYHAGLERAEVSQSVPHGPVHALTDSLERAEVSQSLLCGPVHALTGGLEWVEVSQSMCSLCHTTHVGTESQTSRSRYWDNIIGTK